MDLDVVFLGTAGSMPSAQRAPAALLLRRGGERLLFDCGEGTQRQLQRTSIGLPEIEEIFLTHYHGDHFLGLPGMLKTFALRGREETPLTVYGPLGLRELFARLRPFLGRLPYELVLVELAPGEGLARGDYRIEPIAVDHGVSALGYALVEDERPGRFDVDTADALGVPPGPERGALQRGEAVTLPDGRTVTPDQVLGAARPGRTVVLTGDTAPSPAVVQAAHLADLLVHDATFLADEAARGRETLHATAAEAAEVARLAQVKMLALTHVSARYFARDVEQEACAVFANTVVPRDFDVIEVPLPERGGPRLVRSGARPDRGHTSPPAVEAPMIHPG